MQRRISIDLQRRHLLAILVLSLVLFAACSSFRGGDGDDKNITGQVIGLEARDITRFESLAVIDDERKVWQFIGGAFAGFTPSHLREHQATGDRVRVWYVEDGDELRVTRIEDAS